MLKVFNDIVVKDLWCFVEKKVVCFKYCGICIFFEKCDNLLKMGCFIVKFILSFFFLDGLVRENYLK